MALAAISCSYANKALLNLIKIHARKMEADSFGKGYLCVCMCVMGRERERAREREREQVLSDAGDKR